MKIGILTFHRAHNYGAVLQAYALQEISKNKGHDVEIIDYRPKFIESAYRFFKLRNIRSRNPLKILINTFIEIKLIRKKRASKKIFHRFLSTHLNIGKKIVNKTNEVPKDYDLYIHGSDQIWNPRLTGGYDSVFLGDYETKGEKITYAASFELKPLSEESKQVFSKYLDGFKAISIREKKLTNIIAPLTKNYIYDVLDPTLLVDSEIWEKIITKPTVENYILIYQVGTSPLTKSIANKIANKINCGVIDLNDIHPPTVNEFVGYFKYASFIVSTSFHGTAFSIIFKKPFCTVALGMGTDVRYTSLLNYLNLKNRIAHNMNINFSNIDYELTYLKLNTLKEKSRDYLFKYL